MLARNQNMKRVRGAAISVVLPGLLCAAVYLLLVAGSASAGSSTWGENVGNDNAGNATESSPGAQPAKPDSPDCGPNWTIVDQSHPGSQPYLYGVAAVSSSSVWAVGSYVDPNRGQYSTLIEHWNGSSLNLVPSPNAGGYAANYLYAVTAAGPGDVWAVGNFQSSNCSCTLTEHWDGSAWTIVPSPSPYSGGNILRSVAAVSSNDVWAVGDFEDEYGNPLGTLIEHWNGSAWNVVGGALLPYPYSGLNGVTAISASNIWTVGIYYDIENVGHTLIEHWNGSAWSQIPSVDPNSNWLNVLTGVAAVSADDVWAVGYYGTNRFHTLVEHWNGSSWSQVYSPNPNSGDNFLNGVTVVSSNDVWAVGYSRDPNYGLYYTLVEHWDGNSWNHISTPNPPAHQVQLDGVAAASGADVWASGYWQDANGGWNILVERYNPCITPTPTRTPTHRPTNTPTHRPTHTPLPTQTPGGPTATPVPSNTPGPQPTSCSIQFTDVPPGSTFYSYVRCLACRGIVSGYPDGTFHPSSDVTRGQIAKFVSQAAGYQDTIPPDRQTFADVPPGSTFWLYVERAYLHGVINGYTSSPPCPSTAGTPCFLPGAQVTRGQTAKFVSQAAGYQDLIPPDRQTFTDVSPNSTFWIYVERVAQHGIVNGYTTSPPCTTGTPCFLPGTSVTRGQAAKFISNTFFPDCQTPSRAFPYLPTK